MSGEVPPAIRTSGLTRDFGAVRAVDGLTIEIRRGSVFGFLGPNGSGKTTTIRLLLGLLDPTSGRAEVLGHDVATRPDAIRERSGALLEHTGLYERLTAEENLEFYGRIWHLPRAERRERIRDLLDRLGLWERRTEAVANWSRGMKQKLAVARTLLHRPDLVFLDEPTAGLDPVSAAALRDDLADLVVREGVTVFLTTHNLVEAEKLCHEVGILRRGRLVAAGPPDLLRSRGRGPAVEIRGRGLAGRALDAVRVLLEVDGIEAADGRQITVGLRADASPAPVVAALVREGAEIEEVRRCKADLEEVFLALMEENAEDPMRGGGA